MINSVFVLIAALVVFAFGYRFFSKFLAIWVFRPNPAPRSYSTPVPQTADSGDRMTSARYMPLVQRAGSLAAAVTIVGATLAVAWGWVPVFLWVVCGSVVGAGTYAMGSLWLAKEHRDANPAGQARIVAGDRSGAPMLVLIWAFALLVNTVMAITISETLPAYPESTIPFLLQTAIALAFGLLVHRHSRLGILPGAMIALAASLLALWVFHGIPLEMVGQIQIQSTGDRALTIDARTAWVVIVFAFAWYGAHQPPWKLALPFGLLSTALLGTAMLVLFASIAVAHPALAAPAFYRPDKAPAMLPWLFVTVTSGAIGGWHALVANRCDSLGPDRANNLRRLGYGGAIVDAVIALGAILIGSAAFSSRHAWLQAYGNWDSVARLGRILQIYIRGFAVFGHAIGLNATFASSLAALTLMCLSMTTLIAGIRLQRYALEEMMGDGALSRKSVNRITGAGLILAAALSVPATRGHGLNYWPLFGSAGMAVTAAVLAVMVLALAQQHLPLAPAVTVLLLVLGASIWALVLELFEFWSHHQWVAFGTCLALALVLAAALWPTGMTLYQSLRDRRR